MKGNSTKKEALGSQVGPNPESYGSYRKLRADIKSNCFSLSKKSSQVKGYAKNGYKRTKMKLAAL